MSRDDKAVLAFACAAAVLVPVAVGNLLGWSPWLWLPLALLLLGATGLGAKQVAFRRQQAHLRANYEKQYDTKPELKPRVPPQLDAPPADASKSIASVPLPSAEKDYRFLFSATVHWRPAEGITHLNPAGLAIDAVLARARQVTHPQSPADPVVAEHRLAAALGTRVPDPSGQVLAWADSITLTVPQEDVRRIATLIELRKREQIWEHERALERNMRDYLSKEVLKDTGSAIVWWLSRNPDQITQAAAMIPLLAQLTAAANNAEVPEQFRALLPEAAPQLAVVPHELKRLRDEESGEAGELH